MHGLFYFFFTYKKCKQFFLFTFLNTAQAEKVGIDRKKKEICYESLQEKDGYNCCIRRSEVN